MFLFCSASPFTFFAPILDWWEVVRHIELKTLQILRFKVQLMLKCDHAREFVPRMNGDWRSRAMGFRWSEPGI